MSSEVDRLLDGLRSADEAAVRGLIAVVADRAQEEPDETPPVHPLPDSTAAGRPSAATAGDNLR